MPRAGDVVAGKYRIEAVIGEGGMGAVFSAAHLLTGKRVALKWMLPELAADQDAVQRFVREAQAAGRIDHPNVVDIYDVGEHEGSTFLVMELLQGETLTAASNRGTLDAQQVIRLLLPAMRGVAAAHKTGVVHRDLKPDNIFLCRGSDGGYREPKVLDFGISKVSTTGDQLNPRLTRTGAVMGTPYYMSPEQIRGSAEVDERTDVYAFGVILYEALTGRVPFDAQAYSALILEIATGTPKRPRELRPELPEALERVVMKAMAREPEQRHRDVEGLARALEPFADGLTFRMDGPERTGHQRNLGSATTPFTSEGPAHIPGHQGGKRAALAGVAFVIAVIAFVGYRRSTQGDVSAPHATSAAHAGGARPATAPRLPPATHSARTEAIADAGQAADAVGNPSPAAAAPPSAPTLQLPAGLSPEGAARKPGPGMEELDRAQHRTRRSGADSAPTSGVVGAPHSASGRTGAIKADEF